MKLSRIRHIASWLLLAVFVPMLMLSSLHVHEISEAVGVECVECVTHTPHAGHFSGSTLHVDTCVLCQFLAISFLAAAMLAVLPFQRLIAYLSTTSVHRVTPDVCGLNSVRAPPFMF